MPGSCVNLWRNEGLVKNRRIVKLLEEMADLLEIKGENPFRIRAYRRAAQNIESLTSDVEEIAHAGELEQVPGVGKDLAKKIGEFIHDGRVSDHEKLKEQVPLSLLDLLAVPGLGPKKVRYLHEELGVKDLQGLERAASEGALRDLPGFGVKTEAKILKGITFVRQGRERFHLGTALPVAAGVIEKLETVSGVEKVAYAGSLRRCRETVKDIDLLVASSDPAAVMERFTTLSTVEEIVSRGDTKAQIRTLDGIPVDLRVVERGSFGAALQYFTGSQAHNVKLRELAVKKGLKLNEYGVTKVRGGRNVAGRSEEEVYGALGLPLIPPEIREDRGEIEAAGRNELPRLVELDDIKGDMHMHTRRSDGKHSLGEIVDYARKLGYAYIAVTEHSRSLRIAGGIDIEELREQFSEIRSMNEKLDGFRILTGIEVDILRDGSLDFPDAVLSECDFVIASIHSAFSLPRGEMTNRIIRAMENPHVDLLAHPTGRLLGERGEYDVDIERVIETAAVTGTALEINAYPKRLDLNDLHCSMAREHDVKLAINTDMHGLDEFHHMGLGVSVARRAWCTKDDILNATDTDDLVEWLHSKSRHTG